jgi:N-acetylglucosaminyldiphosphoundecaprenol N-acetyl-beta-D-mannosaminyltransferase
MMEILHLAEKKNIPVFLAARKDGLSTWQETKEAILKKYPKLSILGKNIFCHPRVGGDPVSGLEVFSLDYRLHGNDNFIVFCNFGAPHQELFLNSLKNDNIRIAMGVGGSFDFLTGKMKRAPVFMRRIGLEWLWRLLQQPQKRWKRIWNAVVVFPVKVIFGNKTD